MDIESAVEWLDLDILAEVVRRVLDDGSAEVASWHRERIDYANVGPGSRALYRVSGTAYLHGELVPWSTVLKVFRAPEGDPTADLSDERYYRREVLAYSSALLASLHGGLTAPRHFGVSEWPGAVLGLWLEDLAGVGTIGRSLERYGLAAHHLGAFGGAYLAGKSVPTLPWLSRRALATWVADHGPLVDLIRRPEAWQLPLVRQAFPRPVADDVLRLWSERATFFDALEHLPRTLCHHDASPTNLFARRDADGREQTVAIDWELVGHGAVGEDIGNLVPVSVIDLHVPAESARELEGVVLDRYLAALAEGGWQGDPRQVRLAYAATAGLRWLFAAVGWPLAIALDESGRHVADSERRWERPIEDILDQWAALAHFLLERAETARSLVDS